MNTKTRRTSYSYHLLGLVQRDMGDLKGALASSEKAANMGSNVLCDHQVTAYTYHLLGLVQRDMGNLKEASDPL